MESRLLAEKKKDLELVGGPLFAEWKLKNKESDLKYHLVSVVNSVVRWSRYAEDRYRDIEDLEMVAGWAVSRAQRRS